MRRVALLPAAAALAGGLVLASGLAGCASQVPATDSSSMSPPAISTPGNSAPATSEGPGVTTGPTPSFSAKPLTPNPFPAAATIRGTVSEGVELGCMLLTAEDGKIYLLLGGDRALIGKSGRLEVVGKAQPGLATTCQQGIPFKVSQVKAI